MCTKLENLTVVDKILLKNERLYALWKEWTQIQQNM